MSKTLEPLAMPFSRRFCDRVLAFLLLALIGGCGHGPGRERTTGPGEVPAPSEAPPSGPNSPSSRRAPIQQLPSWLADNQDVVRASHEQLQPGIWLFQLTREAGTLFCIERRSSAPESHWCWQEPRPFVRAFVFRTRERDSAPGEQGEPRLTGMIALEHEDRASTGFWFRFPEAEQAPLDRVLRPRLRPVLPPWFAGPSRQAPRVQEPDTGYRAMTLVEAPNRGPLAELEVTELRGGGLFVRDQATMRICIKLRGWRCTAPVSRDQDGTAESLRENVYLDAFALGGGKAAALRANIESGSDQPGTQGRGTMFLELYSDGEVSADANLQALGSISIGGASWSVRRPEDSNQGREALDLSRSFHRVHGEHGCLRFERAVTDEGTSKLDFVVARGGRRHRPSLQAAPPVVALAPIYGAANAPLFDFEGLWEIGAEQLRRTDRCESTLGPFPTCAGKLPDIPESLPEAAKECLADANRAARAHQERAQTRNHEPCGATEQSLGVVERELRYEYRNGQRIRALEQAPRSREGHRGMTTEVVHHYRGSRRLRTERTTTQYFDEEPDCINHHETRYRHDGRGRVIQARHAVSPCEGEPRDPYSERFTYRSESGFVLQLSQEQFRRRQRSQGAGDADSAAGHYLIPDALNPQAEVTCGTACTCAVELRDCVGHPVARISAPRNIPQVLEYRYNCDGLESAATASVPARTAR